jgi:CubicO group peptidase (beta-lactamase class C family)
MAASLGFDSQRLARIGPLLQACYIDTGLMPCADVTVMRRGEVAYRAVLGRRDIERDLPCTEDSLYRIYSMTKPLASIALMMLVEEGALMLSDPVHRYIPSWEGLQVYAGGRRGAFETRPPSRPMQVVDLMRHTSGLTYGFQFRNEVDAAYREMLGGRPGGATLATMAEALAGLPLDFSPGEAWNYSVSTDIVGYLVEVISGMPFQDFLQQRVLDPLGMTDTAFWVPPEKADRFAACYQADEDGRLSLQDDPVTGGFRRPPTFYSGGGGLVSTTDDYLSFCRMLLGRGALYGERLISPRTLSLMTTNHLPGGLDLSQSAAWHFSETAVPGIGFGLGFAVVMDPARTLTPTSPGEYYWGGMARTIFWIDPLEEIAVLFMTQLIADTPLPIRQLLRTLVYSALVEPNAP